MEMQQVDLGFVKFEVTRQAIVAFVFGFCVMLLTLLLNIAVLYKNGIISNGAFIGFITFMAFIAILYGILAGYSINCMVVGKCIKLSWIITGLYVFISVIYFMMFIGIMMGSASTSKSLIKTQSRK